MLGLYARYLAAPPFTRADGLEQEVAFLQWTLAVRLDFSRLRTAGQ